MPKRKNLILCNSNLLEFGSPESIKPKFENSEYNEGLGMGIRSVEEYDSALKIVLIKRTSTFIFEYNSVERQLEKRPIFIFLEIDISIDLVSGLICVFGPSSNFSIARLILQRIIDKSLRLEPLFSSPYSLFNSFYETINEYALVQVTIENFVYENGASGKYDAEITKQKVGRELINSCKHDIRRVVLKMNINQEDEFLLYLNQGGIIGIQSEEKYFDDCFLTTKDLIIRKNA